MILAKISKKSKIKLPAKTTENIFNFFLVKLNYYVFLSFFYTPCLYLCRRKAYSRKSNSSTNGSEKSVPVEVDVKARTAVKIRVSVNSASSSVTTEKTYEDANTSDSVSHVSSTSQSVRSLPEFIPNYNKKLEKEYTKWTNSKMYQFYKTYQQFIIINTLFSV